MSSTHFNATIFVAVATVFKRRRRRKKNEHTKSVYDVWMILLYLIRYSRVRLANIIFFARIYLFVYFRFVHFAFVALFECNDRTEMNENNSLFLCRFCACPGSLSDNNIGIRHTVYMYIYCIYSESLSLCNAVFILLFGPFNFGISFVNIVYNCTQCVNLPFWFKVSQFYIHLPFFLFFHAK